MSQNLFNLDGKVILVTGGNSGIGLGMAEALAACGANICVWGRKPEKNESAAEKLRAFGTDVRVFQCDMGDEQEVDRTFQAMIDHFGRLDACFANAGVTGMAMPFEKMTTEEWRRVLHVNLDGTFFTLRRVARQMVEQKQGGSLVVTASLSATEGQPYGEPYATSKGGLIAMVRALSVEYAHHGIRVNALLPGWIETQMTRPLLHWKSFSEGVLKRVPMKRWGAPSDFGGIAVYLASDMSAYHTGDTLVIDGDYSIF